MFFPAMAIMASTSRNPVANGNSVQGNLIGLDAAGTNGIGNGTGYGGVLLDTGATNNIIGGTVAGARNVISGNNPAGVFFNGASTSGNLVEGNYIGTDITGTNAVPNTLAGVYLPFGASGNIIGGTVAGARNVISGNLATAFIWPIPAPAATWSREITSASARTARMSWAAVFAGVIIFAGAHQQYHRRHGGRARATSFPASSAMAFISTMPAPAAIG